jgi:hypothetical protein
MQLFLFGIFMEYNIFSNLWITTNVFWSFNKPMKKKINSKNMASVTPISGSLILLHLPFQ